MRIDVKPHFKQVTRFQILTPFVLMIELHCVLPNRTANLPESVQYIHHRNEVATQNGPSGCLFPGTWNSSGKNITDPKTYTDLNVSLNCCWSLATCRVIGWQPLLGLVHILHSGLATNPRGREHEKQH